MKRLFLSMMPLLLAAGTLEAAPLPALDNIQGHEHIEIENGYKAADLFRHFSSECGGRLLFLGTVKEGRHLRLTLLAGPEAASYIEADGDGKYPWLMACEGAEKFLLEKEHKYGSNGARVHLYKGRALEGVDYASTRRVEGQPVTVAAVDDGFAEKMAAELAAYRMDFVATNQGMRFEGRLEQRTGSCDTVSIVRSSGSQMSTLGFKVCSGRVYPLGAPLAMNAVSKD